MAGEQRSQRVIDAEFEVVTGPGGTPLLPKRRKFSPLLIMGLMWRVWSVTWIGALALMFVVAIVWHPKPHEGPIEVTAPPPLTAAQQHVSTPQPMTEQKGYAWVSGHRLWIMSGVFLAICAVTGVAQGLQDRARRR